MAMCDSADRSCARVKCTMTPAFRRLAIRHALLSYMFGALIIAVTINLIAGLGK